MSFLREVGSTGRHRWVAVFAALVLVTSAVPVLAAESPEEPSAEEITPPSTPEDFDPSMLPGPEDVGKAIAEAEREEEDRETWLASPDGVREREESRFAFAGLDASSAGELLRSVFGEELAQLNQDPARFLSDAELVSSSEPTSATVKDEGNGMVMDSSLPVRVEDEQGDLRKVDLSLEETGSGFVTENALVDVEIAAAADQPIQVGDKGVAIKLAGADQESVARPFGDENTFAFEVLPDTDMLVSPIATGVEISNLLRSEASPEVLRFAVEMPVGAVLRASGDWGAEVVRDGEILSTIAEPTALDAQGTAVPVDLQVDGDTLVLTVDHREGDYAMPILVDPILENDENWVFGQNYNALEPGIWSETRNVAGMYLSTHCIFECFPGSGRGLYVSAQSGYYWPNQFAHWTYSAPNVNSFVTTPTLAPYVRHDHGCNAATTSYKQPHDYFGVWGHNEQWVYKSVNSANSYGNTYTLPYSGLSVIFGLHSGGAEFAMPCWRDLYAGGAHIWLDDWAGPSVYSVQKPPTQWIRASDQVKVVAQASDAGLGIQNVVINPDGGSTIRHIPTQNQCAGTRRSPCLTSHTATFNLTGTSFREGRRTHSVTTYDATGKTSSPYYFETKVDATAPEVILDGQFAEATEEDEGAQQGGEKIEKLRLPVYNLKIESKDGVFGDGGVEAQKGWRSGVKDIEIYVDGGEQDVPWGPSTSCTASCPMTQTYRFELSELLASGEHTLNVKVRDFVNNVRERDVEFEYFPATGMKDDYVMHYFPLPDGGGGEEGSDRPELAVNVMNGNLVYRERDIDVDSAAGVDLEVERYYNSMLPENEDTEWGDGWTLAQTPKLEPEEAGGEAPPTKATMLRSTAAYVPDLGLPTGSGQSRFDPTLRARVTKQPGGGYLVEDETGEAAIATVFDASGKVTEGRTDGYAKVDYSYESGELAEIEVSDPSTFVADPSELEIPEPELIAKPTYNSSFGANGSGDGQLKSPGDVVVDAQGNLWVVDKGNNRVQKFDSTGKFLAKFGSLGAGDGQFNRPTAIAIAANGDLLVTDAGNGRVQRFSSAGAYLSKFGSKGTGNGQFTGSGPEGIAIDTAGNIWVSDTYGGRLQKFSSAGSFIKSVATKGSGTGQLGEPTGIDVDPSGNVWVADWQNNRVSVFNSNGEFVKQIGSYGSGDGQFSHPDEIEIDSSGRVWVGDQSNNRVQRFDLAGQFKGKFGSGGSGPGQFSLTYPMGIAAGSKGRLWVSDPNNHRVQQWLVPIDKPTYDSTFGSVGTGDGKLSSPADVAVGVEGNLWVVDKNNKRIQKFDPSGKFLSKFGSAGSGSGQFNRPAAIAVDRDGNLLVADADNYRIQKFSPEGEFLSKFGSAGSGNGQFSRPEGVAADFQGNIWVADTYNGRLQKFDEDGNFIAVVSERGAEPGQLGEPTGIDIDADGRVWVADWQNNRVSVFDSDGEFVGDFGSYGSGNGQFMQPDEIEIDAQGNVWVGDQNNGRVQRFDLDGIYVGQFGSKGSGAGQFSFSYPVGIAADREGRLWIADSNNHRIQKWLTDIYTAAQPSQLDLSDGDPKVEVETPGGLVSSVSGNAAGNHTYEHEGDFLTAHDGPEGETIYEKDPATGLLSKVTLPNGTWAKIKYRADNRVESVEVAPSGTNAKTTTFEYTDAPNRRTVVDPPDAPHVTYDIGIDGSVLKWWNTAKPPTIEPLLGSLYANRETSAPISAGDYYLTAKAWSAEGIASINIIVNGNTLVDEMHCEQTPAPGVECVNPPPVNEWVTETGEHSPGTLNVEVLVTDHAGGVASERFWVNIPETPPPLPGAPIPPKFKDIKQFREDFGLEVVFPVVSEIELNERIFNLIKAWHEGDPVARASWERWGVPLRPADVAELEYREWFYNVNGDRIDGWVEATNPGTFAGYYIDHAAGGIMHVGFTTQDQSDELTSLKSSLPLVAHERLAKYPTTPTTPYMSLPSISESIFSAMESNATLRDLVDSITDGEGGNVVHVGTQNVAQVDSILDQMLGPNAPIVVEYSSGGSLISGRYRNSGRMRAGDNILYSLGACTAGFGAYDEFEVGGKDVLANFVLTAGHCFPFSGIEVSRSTHTGLGNEEDWAKVGEIKRLAYTMLEPVRTDAEAIRTKSEGIIPRGIFGWDGNLIPTEPASKARVGNIVCFSGARTQIPSCGPIKGRDKYFDSGNGIPQGGYWVKFKEQAIPGDSGSPVWNLRTGASVGLATAIRGGGQTLVEPLLHPPNMWASHLPGILNHERMRPLRLKLGG